MDIFKKLNYIFDRKQKWQTLGLFALIVLGTVFELLGVSTVQPLINAIMDRDNLSERGGIYTFVYHLFHLMLFTCFFILIGTDTSFHPYLRSASCAYLR